MAGLPWQRTVIPGAATREPQRGLRTSPVIAMSSAACESAWRPASRDSASDDAVMTWSDP